jgi:hypothetical protein
LSVKSFSRSIFSIFLSFVRFVMCWLTAGHTVAR